MRVLDLFCCGGGAGMGYHRAGFEVTGVDIKPQPEYPFNFIQGDALKYLLEHGHEFDLIHASPPCQGYSKHVTSRSSKHVSYSLGKDEPRLIGVCRDLMMASCRDWVIENVTGARGEMMDPSITLCGTMFGLPISRHRIFETSRHIAVPTHPKCSGVAKRFAAENNWDYRDMSVTGKGRHAGTSERWKKILGIDWNLRQSQLAEAIPPAYTHHIGIEFLNILSTPRSVDLESTKL